MKSDEQSDLLQSKTIQNSLKRKLSLLSQDEIEIASLKEKVKFLSSQVGSETIIIIIIIICPGCKDLGLLPGSQDVFSTSRVCLISVPP